jgi:hypothetical protein
LEVNGLLKDVDELLEVVTERVWVIDLVGGHRRGLCGCRVWVEVWNFLF